MMDYFELATLANKVLEIGGDTEESLATVLDTLEEGPRTELLVSDFLNAFQVFYYFFRTIPEPTIREHLILTPAADLKDGILVEGVDIYHIVFFVRRGEPYIAIGDGEKLLTTFKGKNAYRAAHYYLEELPFPG